MSGVTADIRPQARRAALVVHAMANPDREWLLAQLPADERTHLQEMLSELESLGIPASGRILDEVLGTATPARQQARAAQSAAVPPATQRKDSDEPMQVLRTQAPATLARLLRDEPPLLLAHLLHAQRWPWQQALLDSLDPPRAQAVERSLRALRGAGAVPAPALQAALLARLMTRLELPPATEPQPVGVRTWRWQVAGWLTRRRT